MKRLMIMVLATLLGCNLTAQNKDVIERINNGTEIKTGIWWIDNQDIAERTISNIGNYDNRDLNHLTETAEKVIKDMDDILETRNAIIVQQKKESKQKKALSKYFKEPEKAMEYFAQAEAKKQLAQQILSMANGNKDIVYNTMPEGKLTSFSFSSGNGYAGWRSSVELKKNEDGKGGTLTYNNENMRRVVVEGQEGKENKPDQVSVDDSVFVKVYKMIKEGELYNEANHYQPVMDIMDGTSWSLWMSFENRKYISTGGYMAGPNHSETLSEILKYLKAVHDKICPPKEDN